LLPQASEQLLKQKVAEFGIQQNRPSLSSKLLSLLKLRWAAQCLAIERYFDLYTPITLTLVEISTTWKCSAAREFNPVIKATGLLS
jgi:hypothetical protein